MTDELIDELFFIPEKQYIQFKDRWEYKKKGLYHRIDGPAIDYKESYKSDNNDQYWINGIKKTYEDWYKYYNLYNNKIINNGNYACLFHPNIPCNGEHENIKYVSDGNLSDTFNHNQTNLNLINYEINKTNDFFMENQVSSNCQTKISNIELLLHSNPVSIKKQLFFCVKGLLSK